MIRNYLYYIIRNYLFYRRKRDFVKVYRETVGRGGERER